MSFAHLLRGACDIHVHAAPSLMARELDGFEMARRAARAGYAAVVLKDHHSNTAPVAAEIMENLRPAAPLQIFGSICLNNAVGGINPYAVEAALGFGAKTVWLPTASSENHLKLVRSDNFPHSGLTLTESPVRITDGGRLRTEVADVLALVAAAPGAVLAMGHISAADIYAVLDRAAALGIQRIVVDHPTYFVGAAAADLIEWSRAGAYIEHTATGSLPGSVVFHTDLHEVVDLISAVGPEHTILSSDAGQARNGCPVEILNRFLTLLADAGIGEAALSQMVRENPRRLLGI